MSIQTVGPISSSQSRKSSAVAILIADSWPELQKMVTQALATYWHPDFTLPRIVAISDSPDSPVAMATRWVGRYAAVNGRIAPVINPARGETIRERFCVHRIGITELLLDPDPVQIDQLYAIGIWTRLTSKSRRFWMRFSPSLPADIAENAGTANPVLTVQVGGWRMVKLAIVSCDLIASEVTGRALRSVIQTESAIGISPWQEPIVQAAIEHHLGARSGSEIALQAEFSIPSDHPDWIDFQELLNQAAGLIDTEMLIDRTPALVNNGSQPG